MHRYTSRIKKYDEEEFEEKERSFEAKYSLD